MSSLFYIFSVQKPPFIGCTVKDSKKEAQKFRASFNFVLYHNKQSKYALITDKFLYHTIKF